MNEQLVGRGLVAGGALAMVIGGLGWAGVFGGDDDSATTPAATATPVVEAEDPTPTPMPDPTATPIPEPEATETPAPTATGAPTATSEPEPTPTPTLESLDEFVEAFNSPSGRAFQIGRLHPVLDEVFEPGTCDEWIDSRFIGTTIALAGDPTTPGPAEVNGPEGPIAVDQYFTAPVVLTFQGTPTETTAAFAYVDGLIHWFTNCDG